MIPSPSEQLMIVVSHLSNLRKLKSVHGCVTPVKFGNNWKRDVNFKTGVLIGTYHYSNGKQTINFSIESKILHRVSYLLFCKSSLYRRLRYMRVRSLSTRW